ncbi:serine protease [bacterium]|nr:serine protease [bacterium]MBU1958890.1 serine protease [bacterium]
MKNSVVTIESIENNSFGTGFVIDSDTKGVYVLTCQHVLDDVVTPIVDNVLAKIVATGDFIDMAVLYVSKLHLEPFPLQIDKCDSLDVDVIGFSNFNQSVTQKKHINATLYKESIELHSKKNDLFYNVRKIKANDGFNFDRGNSGSPVICKNSGKVIAMISNKEGSDIGYAVDIANLKEVWKDMPTDLLQKSVVKIEPVSGVQKDKAPQEENKESKKEKKLSLLTYLLFFITAIGIFVATYLYLSHTPLVKLVPPNTIEETKVDSKTSEIEAARKAEEVKKAEATKRLRYNNARALEEKGFQALVDKKYQIALKAFEKSEATYPSFHQVKEISNLLKSNINNMNKTVTKRKVLQEIINKYSKDVPKNLIAQLKKQLILPQLILPRHTREVKELNRTHSQPIRTLDLDKFRLNKPQAE